MEGRQSTVGAGEVAAAIPGHPGPGSGVLSPVATPFVATTAWLDNGVAVVSVTGGLELATASVLEDVLLELSEGGPQAVIVDLSRCAFIDLRGLRVLLAIREHLEQSKQPLALVAGAPSLLRVFKITRVYELFEIHPSLAAAIGGSDHG